MVYYFSSCPEMKFSESVKEIFLQYNFKIFKWLIGDVENRTKLTKR